MPRNLHHLCVLGRLLISATIDVPIRDTPGTNINANIGWDNSI
ncbi:MAG TPA: hypothetical protein QGH67_05495 [Alphaproteobacteria bacterium]|nr:hypothetical protein [Alphaproteobacteria bacterium]